MRAQDQTDHLIGANAIADYLGISRNTVCKLGQEGGTPIYRLPGVKAYRARRSALDEWMAGLEAQALGAAANSNAEA